MAERDYLAEAFQIGRGGVPLPVVEMRHVAAIIRYAAYLERQVARSGNCELCGENPAVETVNDSDFGVGYNSTLEICRECLRRPQ